MHVVVLCIQCSAGEGVVLSVGWFILLCRRAETPSVGRSAPCCVMCRRRYVGRHAPGPYVSAVSAKLLSAT